MTKKRAFVALAAFLTIALVLAETARRKYDLTGMAKEWARIHFGWYIATAAEVDREIEAARRLPFIVRPDSSERPSAPLVVSSENPRYFADREGEIVYLTGSHTWSNFQDQGPNLPPREFDYEQYLDFVQAHGHNFFRLWSHEGSRAQSRSDDYWVRPSAPFVRTGPGEALDGGARWDLTRFDQTYFDRLRRRVRMAQERGIYVAIMLFNGWTVTDAKANAALRSPWPSHPFHEANNVNGIDGDLDGDGNGEEVHELSDPRILTIQKNYVRKVIDTVNDLNNVLYEISNESHVGSTEWQHHMIDFIDWYQETLPNQHPVGMTAQYPQGENDVLIESNADWISPVRYRDPPPADGRKVIISDTDHLWGIGGDDVWVWRSFTRGVNPIFMDGYDGAAIDRLGVVIDFDAIQWVRLRRAMGYSRWFADRIDLKDMRPDTSSCSTGYCLSTEPDSDAPQAVVYSAEGGSVAVALSTAPPRLHVEWFDPVAGRLVPGEPITAGQRGRVVLDPPFDGSFVLYLRP